ncbi:MAG: alpha-glucosidase [Coriobacteriales bacterium]|nr:alpha-glucosidase [Coriobacteriales bacterium]
MSNTPWWKKSVIYQVYPRSFADSNGDGIGDIKGITEHLDYLAKLGIDVIWLSPVYQSPNDDNGYDISDYRAIMDEFGTMDDFDRMLARAHELGIRIVMDLVANHTSDEHAWFVESRKSRTGEYRDFYWWRDGSVAPDGTRLPPNNWRSVFSGSAWKYDEATDQWYLHLFSTKQPDLNWENPRVRSEIYDMMRWWCNKGVDGWRMDVISLISKNVALPNGELGPDGYGDFGPYVVNGPRVHEFLREMNREVLSHYDLLTVGEASGATIEEAKRYAAADGSELSMVFQFEHVDAWLNEPAPLVDKWGVGRASMPRLRAILNKWQVELAGQAWNSLYWNNHDQPRCVSRFGDERPEWRVLSAKMLATCLHMMQGTPYIYQGEELGMTNKHFTSLEECRDVEEINIWHQAVDELHQLTPEQMLDCFDHVARDNARTPMQWDDMANAGFCPDGVEPWIDVNPNYQTINAAAALADPDSIFYYYQRLIDLRHNLDIITDGVFRPLLEESEAIWAYERADGEHVLTVGCNWTDVEQPCDLWDSNAGEALICNYAQHKPGVLQPYEAYVTLR